MKVEPHKKDTNAFTNENPKGHRTPEVRKQTLPTLPGPVEPGEVNVHSVDPEDALIELPRGRGQTRYPDA